MRFSKLFFFLLGLFIIQGCKTNEVILFTNKDNSSTLHVTHFTKLFPSYGRCGFGRPFELYTIDLPDKQEKYEFTNLGIHCLTCDSGAKIYHGNLELVDNRLNIHLYEIKEGQQYPLAINGSHRYKVVANEIAK